MIICFNNDDPKIVDHGYFQGIKERYGQGIYGIAYCYVPGHADDVKQMYKHQLAENFFITAHGSKHEIGNKGSEDPDFNISPKDLATILHDFYIPDGSTGNIYLSCCHSGEGYAKDLKAALPKSFHGKVYGCKGGINYPIAPPDDKSWKAA